jgi:hypothetical protein
MLDLEKMPGIFSEVSSDVFEGREEDGCLHKLIGIFSKSFLERVDQDI